MSTAILVDAAFFLNRCRRVYPGVDSRCPRSVATALYDMCMVHVSGFELHRILVYDCAPLQKRAQHPITGENVDFARLPGSLFRIEFHNQLKRLRKVALRLGYLRGQHWRLKNRATSALLKGRISADDLQRSDVEFSIAQKGVDIKIGIDIAALALKRMVRQIVLVSADGDFVPAAKLARREGIDVILDPMWATVGDALYEHIDGLRSPSPRPLTLP